ncbi:MAG: hypothetical protein FWC09_11485 [Lachnospiraceae bacterium]|nr:hypothetical protein [Lachnospiraceae bacterium]
MKNITDNNPKELRTIIYFFIFSFAIMLFATTSSPLYTFNQWDDVNIHFTIGKGLFNGRIHMVDLIDNKGPVIHLIYGLAWFIDSTGHTGVYVLLSLFLALSMIHVYRMALLFIKNDDLCLFIGILSSVPLLIFRRSSFLNSGGSIEEFTLCILTIALYYFTLYFVKAEVFSNRHIILLGMLFAAVFMMKFNLSTFFLGFLSVIFIKMLIDKEWIFLFRSILYFLCGTLMIIAPYLIYALINKSLRNFIDIYFLLSSKYLMPEGTSFITKLSATFSNANLSLLHLAFVIIVIIGVVFAMRFINKWFSVGYSLSLIFLFFSIYLGDVYTYTHIPLFVFIPLLIITTGVAFEKLFPHFEIKGIVKITAVTVIFFAIILLNGLYKSDMFLHRSEPVQIRMAELIKTYAVDDSPTLLQAFGLDYGFYTASGIIPDEPYFTDLNISHDVMPEIRNSRRDSVKYGKYEFVILPTGLDSTPDPEYWTLDLYEHIAALEDDEGKLWHLYHRRFQI